MTLIPQILVGTFLLFSAAWGYFATQEPSKLGATILTTDSSDTLGTFRTNVNTSLTNINSVLGGATGTSPWTVAYLVATSTATSTAQGGVNISGGCYAIDEVCLTTGSDLDGLSDVVMGTPAFGELLMYNGTNWADTATTSLFSTSAHFSKWLSDETGTGNVVFSASPIFTGTVVGPELTLTTPLGEASGGTGVASYSVGDILYASGAEELTKLTIGSTGQVLKVAGGVPAWGADNTGSGGGSGVFATTTGSDVIYPTISSGTLVLGQSATTTLGNIFEPLGNSLFRGHVRIHGSTTASTFTATSSLASIFPFASTTAVTITGTGYIGSVSATNITTTNLTTTALTSGRVPYITTGGAFSDSGNLLFDGSKLTAVFASSTALTATTGYFPTASTSALYLSGINSALVVTNGQGRASAFSGVTCSSQFIRVFSAAGAGTCASVVLTTDVTGILPIANGGTATSTGGVTNGVSFYNGTRITNDYDLLFNGSHLAVASSTFGTVLNLGGVANFGVATSTFYGSGGINISDGCYAIDGNCLSGSGGGGATNLTGLSDVTISSASFGKILMHDGTEWVDTATSTLFSTSAHFSKWLSDESGSGVAVFGTSPSLTTPSISAPTITGATTIAGATLTGNLDAGGASFLEIPNGTGPTADDPGELAHDTSDNQLILDDKVIPTTFRIWSATIASTSPAFISSGLYPVPTQLDGYTITRIQCHVTTGTSKVIAVEDASANASEDITCATTNTTDDGSLTNATYTASELSYIDFGATSGSVDYVTISVFGTWTRD